MRSPAWLLLVLLAGCATPAGGGAGPGGSCRGGEVAELLAYPQRLRSLSAEELGAEHAAAVQALARQKSDVARLRLALLLLFPNTAFHDDARAQSLAEEVATRRNATGDLRPLAALIAGFAADQRRQEERAQRLAQKLLEEERRADALQQKLEGLKAIEKSLLNREPAKPVNVK